MKKITGAEALKAIADGHKVLFAAKGQPDPALIITNIPWFFDTFLNDTFDFYLAPKMIKIGDVEVVAPSHEKPAMGTEYFYFHPRSIDCVSSYKWRYDATDEQILKTIGIFLNREDCEKYAEAVIKLSGGTP